MFLCHLVCWPSVDIQVKFYGDHPREPLCRRRGFWLRRRASTCGEIYARVYCTLFCSTCTMSSLKSSRSLSHLLMSFWSTIAPTGLTPRTCVFLVFSGMSVLTLVQCARLSWLLCIHSFQTFVFQQNITTSRCLNVFDLCV